MDIAAAWSDSANSAAVANQIASIEQEGPPIQPIEDPVFVASLQNRYALGWFAQLGLLFSRWFRALYRSPANNLITALRGLIIGFVFGTAMFRRPHDQRGAQELVAVLFVAAVFSFLTAKAYITAFFVQRAIYYRERAALMYKASTWGISRSIMDLPSVLFGNFLVGVLIYWLAGLRPEAGAFFFFMLTLLIFGCLALVFAQMLSAVFANMEVAGLVFASAFGCFSIAAGTSLHSSLYFYFFRILLFCSVQEHLAH